MRPTSRDNAWLGLVETFVGHYYPHHDASMVNLSAAASDATIPGPRYLAPNVLGHPS